MQSRVPLGPGQFHVVVLVFFYDISKSGSTLKSSNQRIILIHCLPGVSPDAILKPGKVVKGVDMASNQSQSSILLFKF